MGRLDTWAWTAQQEQSGQNAVSACAGHSHFYKNADATGDQISPSLRYCFSSRIHVFFNIMWDEMESTREVIVLHTKNAMQGKVLVQFLSCKLN